MELAVTGSVSFWLRMFRPPLQRAYACPAGNDNDATDADLTDLLRRADQRRPQHAPDPEKSAAQ